MKLGGKSTSGLWRSGGSSDKPTDITPVIEKFDLEKQVEQLQSEVARLRGALEDVAMQASASWKEPKLGLKRIYERARKALKDTSDEGDGGGGE